MIFWWIWTILALIIVVWSLNVSVFKVIQGCALTMTITVIRWLCTSMEHYEILGHSNSYMAVFYGESPSLGDTSAYPMMQIIWWGLGNISFSLVSPVAWSVLIGSVALVFLGRVKGEWQWLSMLWFVTWPLQWQWSFSSYNVILPFLFLVVSNYFFYKRQWFGLGFAMSLAVGCRVESILAWLLFLTMALTEGENRDWRKIGLALVVSVTPLLFMLEFPVPGEGEVHLSWMLNWNFFGLYRELGTSLIILATTGLLLGPRTHTIRLICVLICYHCIMIGFNDWSSRHLLPLGLLVYWFMEGLREGQVFGRRAILLLLIGVNISALSQEKDTFYASPEVFQKALTDPSEEDLFSMSECAWIVEEEPFVRPDRPVLSHFNLLDPNEVSKLKSAHNCIQWCYTHQDWRWTELDIRDRALRLKHLHQWHSEGWYRRGENACLVLQMK